MPPNIAVFPSQDGQASTLYDGSSMRESKLTPQGYADAVMNFAELSSGEGQEYQQLADFLVLPGTGNDDGASNVGFESDLASLYWLPSPVTGEPQQAGPEVKHYKNVEEFDTHVLDQSSSQILFLKGFPSSPWLRAIGSKYSVDPEFFRRHLQFSTFGERSEAYSSPCLPSSSWHLIQLPIYTIGIQHAENRTVQELQQDAASAIHQHHHRLRRALINHSLTRTCDSMIRNYHIFDKGHYIVEQRISICLQHSGPAYRMIVWLDSTHRWPNQEVRDWCPRVSTGSSSRPEFVPVIQHRRNLGLKSHLISQKAAAGKTGSAKNVPSMPLQSAALLSQDYGKTLHVSAMYADPFYALTELFRFSASSTSQVLNLVNATFDVSLHSGDEPAQVSHLRYTTHVIYGLIQQLHEVQQSIKNTDSPRWPKASATARQKAAHSLAGLEADHQCLIQRAQMLHQRCNNSIGVVMNSMAVAESREAIDQAKRMGKLTFLAFIFVPLSFTTSFFGMNVKELDAKKVSIWMWLVVSVPILGLALSSYKIQFWKKLLLRKPFRIGKSKV